MAAQEERVDSLADLLALTPKSICVAPGGIPYQVDAWEYGDA